MEAKIFLLSAIVTIITGIPKIIMAISRRVPDKGYRDPMQYQTPKGKYVSTTSETRSLAGELFGMGAILLSVVNLALLRFGPTASSAVTVGDVASVAISVLLAGFGFVTLRNNR